MKTAVKITAKDGQVFFPNPNVGKDGKVYGSYRVESKVINFSTSANPFTTVKTRSAFKAISLEAFEKAKELLVAGAEIGGKITRTVTMQPQFDGQKPQQVPIFNEDGEPTGEYDQVTVGGQPTYLKDEWTADENAQDNLLSVAYDKIGDIVAKPATKLA